MFSRALQWEWCGAWPALCIQVILELCRCPFFCSEDFKISLPQWRVTIDWIFFAMALGDNTYQLLIVSYMLTSGHDLVTVWLSPQASQQRQPHSQGSWLRLNQQARPHSAHCSRLLMTSWTLGKDIGIVRSIWVYTHDTQAAIQTWLELELPSHVVRQWPDIEWQRRINLNIGKDWI
jgi:hypothetical protein